MDYQQQNEENNNQQMIGEQSKKKKKWYKKWWVWAIIIVVMIRMLSQCSSGKTETKTTSSTTKPSPVASLSPTQSPVANTNTTQPKPTKSPEATTQPKPTKSPEVTTNVALKLFTSLQKNESFPYTMPTKAVDFMKNNQQLFPTKSKSLAIEQVDDSIEYKHLNKNISNYGDKLISIKGGYVIGAEESKLDNTDVTLLHVTNNVGDSFQVIYSGKLSDIFEKDSVNVYGLPIGMSSFSNVSGGTTLTAVLAGSYVEKVKE